MRLPWPGAQGNRIPLGQDFRQIIEVPARLFSFGLDTDFRASFLLEEIQKLIGAKLPPHSPQDLGP